MNTKYLRPTGPPATLRPARRPRHLLLPFILLSLILALPLQAYLVINSIAPQRHDRFYVPRGAGEPAKAFIGSARDFGGPVDLTGVAKSFLGSPSVSASSPWATLVSPSCFVTTAHYGPRVGDKIRFYYSDYDGPCDERTVARYILSVSGGDTLLGVLNAPVSSRVSKVCIPSGSSTSLNQDLFTGLPLYEVGFAWGANAPWSAPVRSDLNVRVGLGVSGGPPVGWPFMPDQVTLVDVGCSGAPTLNWVGTRPLLTNLHYARPSAWIFQIRAAMDADTGVAGERLYVAELPRSLRGRHSTNDQAFADSDGDGIANSWENLFTPLISTAGNPTADSDGDGFTNLQEYEDGTDPTVKEMLEAWDLPRDATKLWIKANSASCTVSSPDPIVTHATDYSGTGNDVYPTWPSVGPWLQFPDANGIFSYADYPTTRNLQTVWATAHSGQDFLTCSDGFTVTMRFKTGTITPYWTSNVSVLTAKGSNGSAGWGLGLYHGQMAFFSSGMLGDLFLTGTTTLAANTEYTVTASYSGGSLKKAAIYLNGVLDGSVTGKTILDVPGELQIGGAYGVGSSQYAYGIREYMAFDRELSHHERARVETYLAGKYLGTGLGMNDVDNDGLPTWREWELGTDPLRFDTDLDLVGDGDEIAAGTDPLVPTNLLATAFPASRAALWVRADRPSCTLFNAPPAAPAVLQAADKSGRGNHMVPASSSVAPPLKNIDSNGNGTFSFGDYPAPNNLQTAWSTAHPGTDFLTTTADGFTVSLRFKPAQINPYWSSNASVLTAKGTNGSNGWYFGLYHGQLIFSSTGMNGDLQLIGTTTLTANVEHTITASYTGGTTKKASIYLDGALEGTVSGKIILDVTGELQIGTCYGVGSPQYAVDIKEYLAFDQCLSDRERIIEESYLTGKHGGSGLGMIDEDGDGAPLWQEIQDGTDPHSFASHPVLADTDGDGVPDVEEFQDGTDPAVAQNMWTTGLPSTNWGGWYRASLQFSGAAGWVDAWIGTRKFVGSTGHSPTLASSGINGLPAADYTVVADNQTYDFAINNQTDAFPPAATGFTAFLVIKPTHIFRYTDPFFPTTGGFPYTFSTVLKASNAAITEGFDLQLFDGRPRLTATWYGGTMFAESATRLVENVPVVMTIRYNGSAGGGQIFVNGDLVASDPTGTIVGTFTSLSLAMQYGGAHQNSLIPELMIYSRPLTNAARRVVEYYLTGKYMSSGPGMANSTTPGVKRWQKAEWDASP